VLRKKMLFIFSCLVFSMTLITPSQAAEEGAEPWAGAYTSEAFAGGAIRSVYCDLVGLVEGSFGGLLFSVAGLVAIAMGVFGEGGQSKNIFIVAIGALTISTAVSLYFGDLGCGNGSAKGNTAKTLQTEEQATKQFATKAFSLPSFSDSEQDAPVEADAETEESEAELF